MASNYLDLSDIEYVKPLSKASKNVDKYFKNSTLQELKIKLDQMKNYNTLTFQHNRDIMPDRDAKIPIERKNHNFYVKVELNRHYSSMVKRKEDREVKLRDIKRLRDITKMEENNNVFPGKYSLNYSAVSKKVKNVIIKEKSNFRRSNLNNAHDNKNLLNKNNSMLMNNSTTRRSILLDGEENISNDNNNSNNYEKDENKAGDYASEKYSKVNFDDNRNRVKKKLIDSVESLKGINSFGNINKGIKFEKYSKRDYKMFGIENERKPIASKYTVNGNMNGNNNNNYKSISMNMNINNDSIIDNYNNSSIINQSQQEYLNNSRNAGNGVMSIDSTNLLSSRLENNKYLNKIQNNKNSNNNLNLNINKNNSNMNINKERSTDKINAKYKKIIKEVSNPLFNFKNMPGRDRSVVKIENYPDGLTYQPNYNAIRPNAHLIMPFQRKPDFSNKKYLVRKLWTSHNQSKNIKILEIEAYLKEQENIYKQRSSHYKENSLDFKSDF